MKILTNAPTTAQPTTRRATLVRHEAGSAVYGGIVLDNTTWNKHGDPTPAADYDGRGARAWPVLPAEDLLVESRQ